MEMHDLCAAAIRETSCVLATAVKVEGHAYRKQGVSMLLTERGDMFGSISPGCLESDLQARVGHVLETGKLEWVEYDMRPEEDWSWGETIGCGGFVLVLLEPVHEELRSVMHEMYACLEEGIAVELLRRFHADYSRTEYVLKRRNGILGHMEIPSTNLAALHAGKESEKEETVGGTERMNPDKAEETEALSNSAMAAEQRWNMPRCLSSVHSPKPRLVIVGAGNDAIPVAGLAGASGFRVVVADWRESLCNAKRFPGGARAGFSKRDHACPADPKRGLRHTDEPPVSARTRVFGAVGSLRVSISRNSGFQNKNSKTAEGSAHASQFACTGGAVHRGGRSARNCR